MTRKNRYIHRSRISEAKFRELVRLFTRYLRLIRLRIAEFCEAESPFDAAGEVDESYFGPRRVKGRRGRGALGKTIVFGKVYTQIGHFASHHPGHVGGVRLNFGGTLLGARHGSSLAAV